MTQHSFDIFQCQVQPEAPSIISAAQISGERASEEYDKPLGCFTAFVVMILGFVLLANSDLPNNAPDGIWFVPIGVGIFAAVRLIVHLREKRSEKIARLDNSNALNTVNRDAKIATDSARWQYQNALTQLGEANQTWSHVQHHIARARHEYNANAFSPFWDEIENAVRQISNYGQEISNLGRLSEAYANTLRGKSHNFPVFPIRNGMLPDIIATTESLKAVVRLGHTNFHFASIWEQRKNREVMIAGFNNIADAVNGIDNQLQSSLSEFEASLRRSLDRL